MCTLQVKQTVTARAKISNRISAHTIQKEYFFLEPGQISLEGMNATMKALGLLTYTLLVLWTHHFKEFGMYLSDEVPTAVYS